VTGVAHIHFGNNGTETALTAVTGCAQLQQADGTLERVNGSSVVIKTASGQPVTVTTTATTKVTASGALAGDITDGATVLVAGAGSDATIMADLVLVNGPALLNIPGTVTVRGIVSDETTAGFTVITSGGTRVAVTTSGGTSVTVFDASLGQLQAGGRHWSRRQVGHDDAAQGPLVMVKPKASGLFMSAPSIVSWRGTPVPSAAYAAPLWPCAGPIMPTRPWT
jgi:hypothetical protein